MQQIKILASDDRTNRKIANRKIGERKIGDLKIGDQKLTDHRTRRMPSIGARTSTNVSIQRVDSPIATRNLDATKIKPRPPSSCFSRNTVKSRNEKFRESKEIKKEVETRVKKIDLTHRDGFFCGTADSINSRLIYLADIGRCDLYGKSAKRMGGDQEALLAITNKTGGTSSDVTRWVTLSNEEFKKKQRARLASNEPRLIETYEAPGFEDVIHERIPLPFNISIDELVEKIEEVDDINYKWYRVVLQKCQGKGRKWLEIAKNSKFSFLDPKRPKIA